MPVATKIAHFLGWEVEETIAGRLKDLIRRDDTGEEARSSASVPRQIMAVRTAALLPWCASRQPLELILRVELRNLAGAGFPTNKDGLPVVL